MPDSERDRAAGRLRQSTRQRLEAVLNEIDERLQLMERLIEEVREEGGKSECP